MLNESVRREQHPLPAVDQVLAQLADAKVFSQLDTNLGFWQIPLSPESARLTTFITPFGRFCFHRLPFGITSAPEHFQRGMSEILSRLPGVVCMIDDVLIHGNTVQEHDERLNAVLSKLSDAGVTINQEKCKFSTNSVKFLGHVVNHLGISPDPEKINAILKVPTPKNVGDIRRFLGTVNQMSKFSPNLAEVTRPLRELLVKGNEWVWSQQQSTAFNHIKTLLTKAPVLALFDPNLDTILSADASSYGLGAVLLQRQKSGELKPVAFISRSMTPTEQRYAQIEKEALAFTWACERLSDYLVGLTFHINTDHKPLVPLFSCKRLEELRIRVQRFRLRMMRFNFTISHVPGKDLAIADTLSRAPAAEPSYADELLHQESSVFIKAVLKSIPATEERLEQIRELQRNDPVCQQIMNFCKTSWPNKRSLSYQLKLYHPLAMELSVNDNLLMRGRRIVIPPPLRQEMLRRIHDSHQGISKCRERASQSVWWPGISTEIEQVVQRCSECCKARRQQPQPLSPTPLPKLPWQMVATDLFELNQHTFLLIIDYYSRYIEIAQLKHPTAEEVVTHTKSIFARHGIPEVVISDNGPQYTSDKYREFADTYQFSHVTSSPYFPQSNGEAERAVGTIKRMLKKCKDPYLALLAYRSTPLPVGYSPSELLMGRTLRTSMPTTREQRAPRAIDPDTVGSKDRTLKARQKTDYDTRHRARTLPPLSTGDLVWLPDRQSEARVEEEVGPESFEVTTSEGTYRRNRRDLIRLPDTPEQGADPQMQASGPPQETEEQYTGQLQEVGEPRRSGRTTQPPDRFDPSWIREVR